jgi:ubiquinone/menaquinone biosynthesis C-methylase UbiE
MGSDLSFTGERFLPSCSGEIAYEHWHRYGFARQFVSGRHVLDAACGEGYGTALLGAVASSAVGIDIDAESITHATARYGAARHVRFVEGSCAALPFPDAMFDVVVSFETIEHVDAVDQPRMLAEFARVLKPGGMLIISSPNKRLYSDARDYVNEFHRHELYRAELAALLDDVLPSQRWYHQRVTSWSGIWAEDAKAASTVEAWLGDADTVIPYAAPEGMYFVVIAGRREAVLPAHGPLGSLLTDAGDSEALRNERNAREVLRLDGLLHERDAALDRQSAHVLHLETLVAEREHIIGDINARLEELNTLREKRDAQIRADAQTIATLEARCAELAARIASSDEKVLALSRHAEGLSARAAGLEAEQVRLEAALTAQERIIAYRQSARWWIRLPWVRLRLLWDRLR